MGTKIFKIVNISITFVILIFIISTLGTVLIKGFPGIFSSIKSPELLFAIKLSLETSVISTLACLVVSIPIAYTLSRYNLKGTNIIITLLRIPLTLPPIVSGVSLLLLFGTTSFGDFLSKLGLSFIFNIKGIIIAQFFVNLPSMITILKAAIEGVDIRLEYVARTLGFSPLKAFCKVTLPIIRNNILAALILTWSKALGEFGAVLMLAGAIRFKTETLPMAIYLNMSVGDLDAVMVSSSILIIISIISLSVFELADIELYK